MFVALRVGWEEENRESREETGAWSAGLEGAFDAYCHERSIILCIADRVENFDSKWILK